MRLAVVQAAKEWKNLLYALTRRWQQLLVPASVLGTNSPSRSKTVRKDRPLHRSTAITSISFFIAVGAVGGMVTLLN